MEEKENNYLNPNIIKNKKIQNIIPVEYENSLSRMESDFHHIFLKNRLETEEFTYVEHPPYFHQLDEFCDIDKMQKQKVPMIIYGEPGIGKSALLANWIAKRKLLFQTWNTSFPEFIFYHSVGSSRQATFIAKFLERLLNELNDFFELNKEVPISQEKLSWLFPRFLEASSQKGKIIIIVDGLHRLLANDGESILKWLPLSLPGNVRLLFTATIVINHSLKIHSNGEIIEKDKKDTTMGGSNTMERVQIEAKRRQWITLTIHPVPEIKKKEIINNYIKKCNRLQNDKNNSNKILNGSFYLTNEQQEMIIHSQQTSNPRYLKVLLSFLAWAAYLKYNITECLEEWIQTENVSHLYETIFRKIEIGLPLDNKYIELENIINPNNENIEISNNLNNDIHVKDVSNKLVDVNEHYEEDFEMNGLNEHPTFLTTGNINNNSSNNNSDNNGTQDIENVITNDKKFQILENETDSNRLLHINHVKGIGELLSKALGLLYVARHGLLDKELYNLLNKMIIDERNPLSANHSKNSRRLSFEDNYIKSHKISSDQWKILLLSLKALGLLFYNDAIIFPMNYEILRDAVWWRYIGSDENELHLHQYFIFFFKIKKVSFRRVEELPWHLCCCSLWTDLKDSITDLFMFQLLYTKNFKLELFAYWQMLQNGPLYGFIIDKEKLNNINNTTNTTSCNNKLNYDIIKKNKKIKNDFKNLIKNKAKVQGCIDIPSLIIMDEDLIKLPSFDIIKEYNKRLEEWYINARPLIKELNTIVNIVTKFMYEYSLFNQITLPNSYHPKCDIKQFEMNEINTTEMFPHSQTQTGLDPTLFYYYERWIWIQFPWLLIGKKSTTNDLPKESINEKVAEESNLIFKNQLNEMEAQRKSLSIDPKTSGLTNSYSKDVENELKLHMAPGDTPFSIEKKIKAISMRKNKLLDQKSWEITSNSLKGITEISKLPSQIKLKSIMNASIAANQKNLSDTLSIISPGSPRHKLLRQESVKAAFFHIPGNNTNSPLNTNLRKSFSMYNLKENNNTNDKHKDSIRSNLSNIKSDYFPINENEILHSEWDIKKSCNQEILYKLQENYNKLITESQLKHNRLVKLREEIAFRNQQKQFIHSQLEEGQYAMESMLQRMERIDTAIMKVDLQGCLYKKINKICEDYPPNDKSDLLKIKKELNYLEFQIKDLQQQKKALNTEKYHVEKKELPELKKELHRSKMLHDQVIERLEKTKNRLEHDKETMEKIYNKRKKIINDVKEKFLDIQEQEIKNKINNDHTNTVNDVKYTTVMVRNALTDLEQICNKIKNATGLSSLDIVYQKFINREELNKSLQEQSIIYEQKLKQMKINQKMIQDEYNSLQPHLNYNSKINNNTNSYNNINLNTNKDYSREITNQVDIIRDTELRLARAEEDYIKLNSTYKELIFGIGTIGDLLGIGLMMEGPGKFTPTTLSIHEIGFLHSKHSERRPLPFAEKISGKITSYSSDEIKNILDLCNKQANLLQINSIESMATSDHVNESNETENTSIDMFEQIDSKRLNLMHLPETIQEEENIITSSKEAFLLDDNLNEKIKKKEINDSDIFKSICWKPKKKLSLWDNYMYNTIRIRNKKIMKNTGKTTRSVTAVAKKLKDLSDIVNQSDELILTREHIKTTSKHYINKINLHNHSKPETMDDENVTTNQF